MRQQAVNPDDDLDRHGAEPVLDIPHASPARGDGITAFGVK